MGLIDRKVRKDLYALAMTTGLGATAALTPRSARPRVLSSIVAVAQRRGERQPIRRAKLRETEDVRRAVAEHRRVFRSLRIEETFCQGFGIFRRSWPANITVSGLDHVRAAHAEGRGLVIWQMSFLDLTPLFIVMADAGYPVSHLSSAFHRLASHGEPSRRLVAPALVRGETRALGRRLMIPTDGSLGYLKELKSIVQDDHGTVSIRGDFTSGRKEIEAPHLDHVMSFPTGAPSLAHLTGAPLLTAAVIRRAPLEHEVLIDEPIAVARDMTRREFQHAAVMEYARRLDARARVHRQSRPIVPFMPSVDPYLS